jgi:HAD superfamily hydrolase (TIGR01450 family)
MSNKDIKSVVDFVKAIAFDLDGTIYFGNTLADDARQVIEELRRRGKKTFFFTNNSSKTRREIADKLLRLGIELSLNEVYTSGYAAAHYCTGKYQTAFVIGTESLKNEIRATGVKVVEDPKEARVVVVGLDIGFSYETLAFGLDALTIGCDFVVCNRDNTFPVDGGRFKPGSGPIVAALVAAGEREPDFMVGKPSTYMLELLSNEHKITASEILVIGDSYSSDIAMAKKIGSPSLLLAIECPDKDTTLIENLSDLLDHVQ